ncbi:MAG: PAS domain S-box protein [Candidatus Roizmanbacteria bacterium]
MDNQFDIKQAQIVLENSIDAIVSANEQGEIVYLNPAAEKMFGLTRQQSKGKPLTILMPEKYRIGHLHGMQRYHDTHVPKVIGKVTELEGVHLQGNSFPMEMSLSAWQDETGRPFFTAIIRDISERKRSALELDKKIAELQKMNEFLIDREIKMVALKKQINELENKHSQS